MQSIAAGAAFAAVLFTAGSAQADEWCRRDHGARTADCRYYSLSMCMTTVRIAGGVCERNHRAAARSSDRHARSYEPRASSGNLSTMRASYAPGLGRITYVGTQANCK